MPVLENGTMIDCPLFLKFLHTPVFSNVVLAIYVGHHNYFDLLTYSCTHCTPYTIHLAQLASCCLLWLSRQIRALLHIMLLYMIVRRQTWHACCLCQSINIFSKLLARRGQSVMATSSVPLQCIHVLMTKLWLTWAAEVVARQKRKGRAPVLLASSSRVLTRSTTGRY